ncbi:hypothetical protein KC315_g20107, partial [Hortaea werneckii]
GVGEGVQGTVGDLGKNVGDTVGGPAGKTVGDTTKNVGKTASGATSLPAQSRINKTSLANLIIPLFFEKNSGLGKTVGDTTSSLGKGDLGGTAAGVTGGAGSSSSFLPNIITSSSSKDGNEQGENDGKTRYGQRCWEGGWGYC